MYAGRGDGGTGPHTESVPVLPDAPSASARIPIRQSEKASGPTAGAETVDALEFVARVVSHIPHKGQVLQRDNDWYAGRTRGIRRRAGVPEPAPAVAAEVVLAALCAATRCASPASSPSPASLTGSSTTCAAMRPPPAARAAAPSARDPGASTSSTPASACLDG
jgi:hypothetical protein